MSREYLLSERARNLDEEDKKINGLWDTLENLWHPQKNPDGIVSLGVAENVRLEY